MIDARASAAAPRSLGSLLDRAASDSCPMAASNASPASASLARSARPFAISGAKRSSFGLSTASFAAMSV
jgi:hypothetical protein